MIDAKITPQQFTVEIENLVKRENLNYVDAILKFCQKNEINIDVTTLGEFVKPLLTPDLKQKLAETAADLHFLPRQPNKLKFK